MRFSSTLLAPSILLLASAPAFGLEGWHKAIQPARAEAKATGKLILVDLYADWCGWCKELEKKVFATAEFNSWAAREAVLLHVDTEDGGDGTMLYRRFGAGSLPTTLLLTADLGLVGRIQGFAPAPKFLAQLDQETSAWKALASRFDALLTSTDSRQIDELAQALQAREDGHRAALLYRRVLEIDKPNPIRRAELLTRIAESHRLAAEYSEAIAALDQAAPLLAGAGEAIAARAELLRSEIAHERGDCASAKSSLIQFLATRPRSTFARPAQRLLDYIESGASPTCA